MVKLRAHDAVDRVDMDQSTISITESDKVIFDFVHIDDREHTVVLPREAALQLANGILEHLEDS